MDNEVYGDFCSLLRRAGCSMRGKGKRYWYLSSCVFMLFSTVCDEKHLAQVRERLRGWCAAQVSQEHYAKCMVMSNFVGCCLCGMVWVPPQCHCNICVTIVFLPEIRQNPLSDQPHHLMWSQSRSLGLTPGNWHYLYSQVIHRIMKFFKGFWGLFFFSVWII